VAKLCGYGGAIRWDTSRPNGQPRRKLATDRAKKLFGFEARIPLEEGLRETIRWYRENR
jgi:GDP-L-fucose synthase